MLFDLVRQAPGFTLFEMVVTMAIFILLTLAALVLLRGNRAHYGVERRAAPDAVPTPKSTVQCPGASTAANAFLA